MSGTDIDTKGILRMYEYYGEYINNGLTYNPYRYGSDTHDAEFNLAIDTFLESLDILEGKFNQFETALEQGEFDGVVEK